MNKLPEGFTLDPSPVSSGGLPEGFTLDAPTTEKPVAGFWQSFGHQAATVLDTPEAIRYAYTQKSSTATPEEKEAARKAFLKTREANARQLEWKDVHGVGDAATYGLEGAGNLAGYIATPIVAGAAGTAAAGPIGGLAAGAGSFFAKHEVENLESQARRQEAEIAAGQKPQDLNLGRSLLTSGVETGFDYAGSGVLKAIPGVGKLAEQMPFLRKLMGEGAVPLAGETAEQAIQRTAREAQEKLVKQFQDGKLTTVKGIVRGVGKAESIVLPATLASTILDRWQNNESNDIFTNTEARDAWEDALLHGAVMGVGLGATEGVFHSYSDRQKAAQYLAVKKAKEAEAAKPAATPPAEAPTLDPKLAAARQAVMGVGDGTPEQHIAAIKDALKISDTEAQDIYRNLGKKKVMGGEAVQFGKPDPTTGVRPIKNKPAAPPTPTSGVEDLVTPPEAPKPPTTDEVPVTDPGSVDPDGALAEGDKNGDNEGDTGALGPGDGTVPPPKEEGLKDDTTGDREPDATSEGGDTGGVELPVPSDDTKAPEPDGSDSGAVDGVGEPVREPVGGEEAPPDSVEPEPIKPVPELEKPPTPPPQTPPKKARAPKEQIVVKTDEELEADFRKMQGASFPLSYIPATDAIDYVARHAPNPFQRKVAAQVGKMIRAYEKAGFAFNVKLENPYAPTPSIQGGSSGFSAYYRYPKIDIRNNKVSGDINKNIGITFGGRDLPSAKDANGKPIYPVHAAHPDVFKGPYALGHTLVLHEFTHSITGHAIDYGKYFGAKGLDSYLVPISKELRSLFEHVKQHVKAVPEASRNEVEAMLLGGNGLANSHEILAQAFSDEQVARYLDTIEYKSPVKGSLPTTVWKGLVASIRKILGLTPMQDTALSEMIRIGNTLIGKNTAPEVNKLMRVLKKEKPVDILDRSRYEASSKSVNAEQVTNEARQQAPKGPSTPDEWRRLRAGHLRDKVNKGTIVQGLKDLWAGTNSGTFERLVKNFQNEWRPLKLLENMREMAGVNRVGGTDRTNIYTNLVGAMDRGATLMTMQLSPLFNETRKLIKNFAKNNNMSWQDAMAMLDGFRIALHEPERRLTKFVRESPLSEKQRAFRNADGSTTMMSAAARREAILDKIADATVSAANKARLEKALHDLVFEKDPQGKWVNLDEYGASPTKKGGTKSISIDNKEYNVVGGYSSAFVAELRKEYDAAVANGKNPEVNRIFDLLKEMHNKQKQMDRQANYWTDYTDGIVAAYGWKNYTPFKGLGDIDSKYELTGKRGVSGEHAEAAAPMEGRDTEANNTLLQTMSDAARSAARAGRKDVTGILKNLIEIKDHLGIKGKLVQTLTAEDRYRNKDIDYNKIRGKDKFFHHLPNGDIEVYKIDNPEILEAIRRPYEEASLPVRFATGITGFMGRQHTRWNVSFAPMNYVKDTLFNAYNLSAARGIGTGLDYLSATAFNSANMGKAAALAKHMSNGDIAAIDKMRNSSDSFTRAMFEYIEQGGRTTYGQTYSITSKMNEIKKEVGRGGVMRTFDQVAHYMDAYNDMFDLTSRTPAYMTLKQRLMSEGKTEHQAMELAAAQAKELTNYRLMGKYGRAAGGLFMFFRPAATSAVAAIDSLRPAWQSTESVLAKYPKEVLADPVKKQAIIDNHVKLKQNSKRLAMALMGAGAFMYTMAVMGSGEDEQGRNRVASDDKERWTRYIRLPILGETGFFQMPWGFGLGGLGAFGAQVAALSMGHQSGKKAIGNMMTIAADSFLPISPSSINPVDNAFAFLLDTVTPNAIRPVLEYAMNRSDMDNEIYNSRQGKYSDVYSGSDRIPEGYKDVARMLYRLSGYKLEISPNTLYFFASSYADSLGRISNIGNDFRLISQGEKKFDYKRDIPFTDSFIGTFANVDAREWKELQTVMQKKAQTLDTLKATDTNAYSQYMLSHPTEAALVQNYQSMSNSRLKTLAEMRNKIALNSNIPKLQRDEMVKKIRLNENILKHNLIERYKDLGIDP